MGFDAPDLHLAHQFAIALLIGALVGVEREKHKAAKQGQSFAGIRTFILIAQAGAIAGWLSVKMATPMLFVIVLTCLVLLVCTAYVAERRSTPNAVGLTTECAAINVFLLGGAVMFGYAWAAIALAVVNASLLAFKEPLHGAVEKLGRDDIYAGLKLLIASFIVLPFLPDAKLDPWHALNPYKLWLLVVLMAGLSLVGYVATRCLGAARGVAITGLSGGLVSSTAVTLSMARESREAGHASAGAAYATGILLAWAVMFGRVLIMIAVVNINLLRAALIPCGAMLGVTLGFAAASYLQSVRASDSNPQAVNEVPLENPFSLWSAGKFALLFAAVLLLVEVARQYFPASGVIWIGALAGLTDVDAISLSMAEFGRDPSLATIAVQAVVAAVLSNTVVKCALAAGLGHRELARRIVPASLAVIVTGLLAVFIL